MTRQPSSPGSRRAQTAPIAQQDHVIWRIWRAHTGCWTAETPKSARKRLSLRARPCARGRRLMQVTHLKHKPTLKLVQNGAPSRPSAEGTSLASRRPQRWSRSHEQSRLSGPRCSSACESGPNDSVPVRHAHLFQTRNQRVTHLCSRCVLSLRWSSTVTVCPPIEQPAEDSCGRDRSGA